MGWQVLYQNKLGLSKQHRESSLSGGASAELNGISDILGKVGEWFLILFCDRSFWFKEEKKNTTRVRRHLDKLIYVSSCKLSDFIILLHILNKPHIYCAEKNWQGLAWISANEHAYTAAFPRLDEVEPEEWKEGNFLPVVCGTESSAVVPVLSFSSDTRGKSKVSDGNDTGAAHTEGYF